ncbi:MAG TPA: hypothetical protein VMF53_13240 [Alphaproteobacteria bacterium]|nr:hypothetical protein [Alphaproteobacteria bacterium]
MWALDSVAAGHAKEEAMRAAGAYNLTGAGDKSAPDFNNARNLPFVIQGHDGYKAGKITGTAH